MSRRIRAPSWTWKVAVALVLLAIAFVLWPLLVLLLPAVAILSAVWVYRLAYQSDETGRSLRPWALPFLWVMLSPLVTVPASGLAFALLVGTHSAQEVHLPDVDTGWFSGPTRYFEVEPALLAFTIPGVLNLGAFVWVFSRAGRVRAAAVVAGTLGLIRTAIPAAVLLLGFHQLTNPTGMTYSQYDSAFHPAPYLDVWLAGAGAWLLSLLVWEVFRRLTKEPAKIAPEKLAWAVGVLAVVVVAAGLGFGALRWQSRDRVLHLGGYDIRESDWRVAAHLWASSRLWRFRCDDVGPLSSELASAAQSPGYPAGSTGSLTGEDWDTFLRRPALTAIEGQTASEGDFREAADILRGECDRSGIDQFF